MAWSKEFSDFVLDQLAPLGDVRARAMFGGVGIYSETVMFGLIADDQLYFRVDELSRARFVEAGQTPFSYGGARQDCRQDDRDAVLHRIAGGA